MLTIHGRASSNNVQKVMWLVGEIGVAHERVDVGGKFGGLDTPEFRAMNPNGVIPVLRDGDLIVWESHAILRYLAAKYAPAQFWPTDPAARSHADRWMDWAQTAWQPDFMGGVFWGFYRTPEAQRNNAAIARAVSACAEHLRLLEIQLADKAFVAGDALTLADIPIGSMMYRYFTLEIERPSLPRVEDWYARLCARPAFQRHIMIAYDDLFGRLAF